MNQQTLDRLRSMKLNGMLRAFQGNLETGKMNELTTDETIAHLVDQEWDDRHNRKIARSLHNARFRYKATMEQIHFNTARGLDKNLIMRLSECSFINKKENILITGSTGIGKSYLASAIGQQACTLGYKVLYSNASKLFSKLKMAKADGSFINEMARIEKQHVLILDDFGIQPLDAQNRAVLMEIMEDRHGKSSTVITSQLPVAFWYEMIGEKTIADAILDRLVHNAQRIEMKGESLRKKQSNYIEEN